MALSSLGATHSPQPHHQRIVEYAIQNFMKDEDELNTFMVIDLDHLHDLYKEWTNAFPRIRPYFAVKCNPDPNVIRTLYQLGAGFDCANHSEMERVINLGISSSDIILANTCKLPRDMNIAKKHNLRYMTFDNEHELLKISQNHNKSSLLIRISCGDPSAKIPFGDKFGAHRDIWTDLIDVAKSLDLVIEGVSFHVGSGASDSMAYIKALKDAHDLFSLLKEKGCVPKILDIGGGFSHPLSSTLVESVNNTISHLFDEDITVIAEPGRYFVETICTHYAKIIGKHRQKDVMKYWIYDSIYGCFADVAHGYLVPNIQPITKKNPQNQTTYKTHIYGCTCDGTDIIAKDIDLPELIVGSWVYTPNMGAYTTVLSTNFNSMDFQGIAHIYKLDGKLFIE